MTQFLFHTIVKWWVVLLVFWFFFLHNIHYTCIASLDVQIMCVLYCSLLYDHIVINVNAPQGPMIGEINK